MENRQYFTFLKSYADIYKQLSDDQKVQFIDAIIEHQLGDLDADEVDFGDALLNIAWTGVKPSLSRAKAQYLNGKKAKSKPNGSQSKAKPEQIRNKKKEIRSKNKEVINKKKEDITAFVPNEASKAAVFDLYPNASIDDLVIDFVDQALNRKQPFKDLQSGFRTYVRKGWVKPNEPSITDNRNAGLQILKDMAR